MNEEVNKYLKSELKDAYSTFFGIINEMRDHNIQIDYDGAIADQKDYYQEVRGIMSKLDYYLEEANKLKEDDDILKEMEYKLYFKYATLYVVVLVFIRLFNEIFDTSKLNEMLKYGAGLFLGSYNMWLLNKDIQDIRDGDKETRDFLNKLKTIKEEYKKTKAELVFKINCMFDLNSRLWIILDNEKNKNK